MRRFATLSIVVALIAGCTKPTDGSEGGGKTIEQQSLCGSTAKIIGGHACSNPQSSPVVMLGLANAEGKLTWMCSGTLVTPDTVLTAAHCLPPNEGISKVFADGDGTMQNWIPALETFPHPGWKGRPPDSHDVGIVKLSQAITTRPVASLMLSSSPQIGEDLGVYGYGQDEDGNAKVLKEGRMEIAGFYQNLIMAMYDSTGNSVCFGDSGGPAAVVRNGVAGIVGINSAVSSETCAEGSFAVFADVGIKSNLDFITEHVPGIDVK